MPYDFHPRALDETWYLQEQVGPAIECSVLLSALIATLLTCSPAWSHPRNGYDTPNVIPTRPEYLPVVSYQR